MYIIPLILFTVFFVMGYTNKKRSGGFLLLFAGFALLALGVEGWADIDPYLGILMAPFAIFIMLLGVKKAFYNDEVEQQEKQSTNGRRPRRT
jgi:hypothetical protein